MKVIGLCRERGFAETKVQNFWIWKSNLKGIPLFILLLLLPFVVYSCAGNSKDKVILGVISIYASPLEGRSPLNVKFFASVSYSGKYEILWNFGDGSSQKTESPYTEHTYYTESQTTFVVSATLIVDGSPVATAFTLVRVFPENTTPLISLRQNYIAIPGEKISIKVEGYDVDGDTIKCSVDLYSNGNSDLFIKVPGEFQFTPTAPGDYAHTLWCDDGYGGMVSNVVYIHSAFRITDVPTSDFDVEFSEDKTPIISFVDLMSLNPKIWMNGEIKEIKLIGTHNIKTSFDGEKIHFVLDAGFISYYGKSKLDEEFKWRDAEFDGCCPDIFVNGNEVMVCFYDYSYSGGKIRCAFSTDSGETFSLVMTSDVPFYFYYDSLRTYPRICGGDGKFFVVWSYTDLSGISELNMLVFKREFLDMLEVIRSSYPRFSTAEFKPLKVPIPKSFTNIEYVSCATDSKNFYLVFSASMEGKNSDIFLLSMPLIERKNKQIIGLEDGTVLTLEYSELIDFNSIRIINVSKSPNKKSIKPEIYIPYITWVEEGDNIMLSEMSEFGEPQTIHEGEYAITSSDWIIWKQYDGIFMSRNPFVNKLTNRNR